MDDNLSKDEIIEEEQAKDEDLELGEGVNEEGLEENMLEEENDEVSNAENEMDEMYETEEEKSLKAESEDENEPVRKKSKKKEESVETIQSLPIAKLCVVVKLKNKFNFFDRFVQTKIISSRVRLLSKNIMLYIHYRYTISFYGGFRMQVLRRKSKFRANFKRVQNAINRMTLVERTFKNKWIKKKKKQEKKLPHT